MVRSPDDHYGDQTFFVKVSDIVGSVSQGQDHDVRGLRVYDGGEWAEFTMRFDYMMKRIDD